MALANQEAQRFNHDRLDTEHILLALIKEGSGVGASALRQLEVDIRRLRLDVEKQMRSGPEMVTVGVLPQAASAKKALEQAMNESTQLGHKYVGSEHLLLGLLHQNDTIAARVLESHRVSLEA